MKRILDKRKKKKGWKGKNKTNYMATARGGALSRMTSTLMKGKRGGKGKIK